MKKFNLQYGLARKAEQFSIRREGANLDAVKSILVKWYISANGARILGLESLVKKTGITKVKRNLALEAVMKSMPDLSPFEQAWLEIASKQRKDIWDFGVELTPRNGLLFVEGGKSLIQQLLANGWKPTQLQILQAQTQQRRAENKEELKKLIFQLAFEKNISDKKPIAIPSEVLEVLAEKVTWQYAHIWFNPLIFKSITVNLTQAQFGKFCPPPQWEITL